MNFQTLFSIEDFKKAVLEAWMHQEEKISDVELAPHPVQVLHALKDIFVNLECGPESVVDPAPLINALRLDSSVQQDGHEFMKLFLTLLEQVPELSAHSLFRGRSGYQTTCMSCNKLSVSSQRFDDFLELDIPIKGFSGLQESLGTLLCPEILDGDNQYFCSHCDGKRDATRQLMVKDLPSVLCLSLQRFVFDLKKMDRVKANDKFSFPLELPASMITHEGKEVYHLEAILLHKGSSARQGHYVAHVNSDGTWYRFDDGEVMVLERGPQGHPDHGGRSAGAMGTSRPPGKKKGKKRGRKKKGGEDGAEKAEESEDGEEKWAQCENPSCSKWRILPRGTVLNAEEPWYCIMNPDPKHNSCDAPEADWDRDEYEQQQREAGLVTSSNAYLLVYKRGYGDRARDASDGLGVVDVFDVSKAGEVGPSGTKPANSKGTGGGAQAKPGAAAYSPALVAWLKKQKSKMDAEFQKKVDAHHQLAEDTRRRVDQRRELVRGILNASRSVEDDDCGFFVTANWLEAWVNAEPKDPVPAVDNRALLCPHGALDPSKVQAAKRLSTSAWQQISDMYGGSPALGVKDTCRECLLEQLDSILLQEDVDVNRELYLDMCDELDMDGGGGSRRGKKAKRTATDAIDATDAIEPAAADDEKSPKETAFTGGFFVGKQWLRNWRSRHGSSMGSSSPTSSLVCEHGMLSPAHPDRPSTRVLIPADFWAYLKRSWSAKIAAEDRKDRFKQAEKKKTAAKVEAKAAVEKTSGKGNADDVEVIEDTTTTTHAAPGRVPPIRELQEFAYDAVECPTCRDELMSHLETHPQKEEEKLTLKHLVSASQNLNMEPNVAYKMVPVEFLNDWRAYMGPSKAAKDPPELSPCMQAVSCTTHGTPKIAFPSPPLVNRRGRWMYANGSDETFEIITGADWEKIWATYGDEQTPFGPEGITAHLAPICGNEYEPDNNETDKGVSNNDKDAKVAKVATSAEVGKEASSEKPSAATVSPPEPAEYQCMTVPQVCHECVIDREKAIRASLLNFEAQEVMVEIVADEASAVGPKAADANQRQSKRARKGRAPIIVDSTTTLENAKLRMFEALGVHPKNVRAFLRGTELLDDSKQLLEYEVVPMDEIRIIDTGVFDVNDLTSIFPDVVLPDRDSDAREGFTGTALHGM